MTEQLDTNSFHDPNHKIEHAIKWGPSPDSQLRTCVHFKKRMTRPTGERAAGHGCGRTGHSREANNCSLIILNIQNHTHIYCLQVFPIFLPKNAL